MFNRSRRAFSSIPKLDARIASLKPSATLLINERSNAMLNEGKTVYKLGLGQSPFPVPDCMVEELKAHAHEKDYLPVAGLRELRDKYAQYLKEKHQLNRSGDNVLIGPGSKELLFISQLAYDAEILIPNPSWVSYEPQAQIAQRQVKWLDTKLSERWVLKPQVLEDHCKKNPNVPRMMIFNFPSNPTGCTHSKEELKAIAQVARKYGIVIIADEICGLITYKQQHTSMAELYPEGTIISGGLSKAFGAGGWRVGIWSFPKELHWLQDAMAVVASETFTSVAAPLQYAAIRAYEPDCAQLDAYLSKSS